MRAVIICDVIRLALQSFPDIFDESNREMCRRYRSQVIACIEQGTSEKSHLDEWQILAKRAFYLREDEIYEESLHWWTLTVDWQHHNALWVGVRRP